MTIGYASEEDSGSSSELDEIFEFDHAKLLALVQKGASLEEVVETTESCMVDALQKRLLMEEASTSPTPSGSQTPRPEMTEDISGRMTPEASQPSASSPEALKVQLRRSLALQQVVRQSVAEAARAKTSARRHSIAKAAEVVEASMLIRGDPSADDPEKEVSEIHTEFQKKLDFCAKAIEIAGHRHRVSISEEVLKVIGANQDFESSDAIELKSSAPPSRRPVAQRRQMPAEKTNRQRVQQIIAAAYKREQDSHAKLGGRATPRAGRSRFTAQQASALLNVRAVPGKKPFQVHCG
jgi:hypothetical protein